MKADSATVTGLFKQTLRYVVPIFQRHYVWTKNEQWDPLWDDIEEIIRSKNNGIEVKPHFLGAVILDTPRRTSKKEVSQFLVIDGQQRLTTFQIFLTALRDVSTQRNCSRIAKLAEGCLLNSDDELMENQAQEKFKLWPTQFNRVAFCKIITAGSSTKVLELFPVCYGTTPTGRKRKNAEERERLVDAYEFFYEKINSYCNSQGNENQDDSLFSLYLVLRDDLTVVEIILGESDDSQEIFNSLNARGKPLSQSDLLRSYIFMRAEKNLVDRDFLYREYWSKFESEWWDFEIRRGNQISSRLDTLTRTLLSSKIGIPVDVKRVHSEYTKWINASKPFETLEDELKMFSKYGAAFEQLHGKVNGPLKEFGRRMNLWETTTVFPLVIFIAVEGQLNDSELSKCLNIIESFIVRRAICDLQAKQYNIYFIEVISRLRASGVSVSNLFEILTSGGGETRYYPNNEDFGIAFKSKPMYNNSRITTSALVEMFRQLETSAGSYRAEQEFIPNLSIEHVMPQQWSDNYSIQDEFIPREMNADWYSPKSEETSEQYNRLRDQIKHRRTTVHCIGNLTIVTQPLNSVLKNKDFTTKKKILSESVLALNRYFDRIENWSEDDIDKRSETLYELARKIWIGPVESLHK